MKRDKSTNSTDGLSCLKKQDSYIVRSCTGHVGWRLLQAVDGSFYLRGYERKRMVKMELAIILFLFLVGIVFIVKGGDYFVDAASWIAEVSGIPKLIIGATIVSLATTLPEMLV